MTSSSGYRLIDYFVISGLDVKCGLEPDQLSGWNVIRLKI